MAAFTTKAAGNWSASGQTTWTQTGVPGDGDSVTLNHAVTVDVDTTIGASGVTGTVAITFGANPGPTLTIAAGKALRVRGDVVANSSESGSVVMNAGSSFILDPANGQTYKVDMSSFFIWWFVNGTAGSRCTFKTDLSRGGHAGYLSINGGRGGMLTAAYTDFTDLGNSSNYGIQSFVNGGFEPAVSITHCTFTRCSYSYLDALSYDLNVTFSNNTFTSSVGIAVGGQSTCADFEFAANASTGVRTADSNSFDLSVFAISRQITWTNNCFSKSFQFSNSSAWPSDSYFANNLIYFDDSVDYLPNIYGSIKNCFLFNAHAGGHYLNLNTANTGLTGCLWECAPGAGNGDCFFPPDLAGSTVVKYSIGLPASDGTSCGCFASCDSNTTGTVALEHNTWCGTNADGGLCRTNETLNSYAGEVPSLRGNIVWGSSATGQVLAVTTFSSGTIGTDVFTVAGYNGFLHPDSGTCKWNTSTSQASVVGYQGVITAVNHNFPNTAIGTGDIVGDPRFVDKTRNLETWAAKHGGSATSASALSLIQASPSLIASSLIPWVRAGWRPRNAAYRAASYPGDASTTDAAGNSWPGAKAGIGAMAFLRKRIAYCPSMFSRKR